MVEVAEKLLAKADLQVMVVAMAKQSLMKMDGGRCGRDVVCEDRFTVYDGRGVLELFIKLDGGRSE